MATQLEIIIYGLACFQSTNRGAAFRVLFPDGRNPAPYRIPPHKAALWVRERSSPATARWPFLVDRNDFAVDVRGKLTITGLKKTPLDDKNFSGRLADLRDSDPNFKIDANPEAIIEMTIDRGRLSAHEFPTGMILVRWLADVEEGQKVTLSFADGYIELPEDTKQVVIANAGEPEDERIEGDNHFMLYRKLATQKTGQLRPLQSRTTPQFQGLTLIDPTHKYVRPRTPFVDCSSVIGG